MRLVIGITGASGAIYAKRLLEVLKAKDVEVDLVITPAGVYTIKYELGVTSEELCTLATECKLTTGNLHLVDGSLTIINGATLIIPSGYNIFIQKARFRFNYF